MTRIYPCRNMMLNPLTDRTAVQSAKVTLFPASNKLDSPLQLFSDGGKFDTSSPRCLPNSSQRSLNSVGRGTDKTSLSRHGFGAKTF